MTPKKPKNPRKLKTSSVFLINSSYRMFSSAYRNAPNSASMSPSKGLLAYSGVSAGYSNKKSLRNPSEIPTRQHPIAM